jgi:hypothetical protein
LIAQHLASACDVCEAVAHVASAWLAVFRRDIRAASDVLQDAEELIEGDSFAVGDVDDVADARGGLCGAEVGVNDV